MMSDEEREDRNLIADIVTLLSDIERVLAPHRIRRSAPYRVNPIPPGPLPPTGTLGPGPEGTRRSTPRTIDEWRSNPPAPIGRVPRQALPTQPPETVPRPPEKKDSPPTDRARPAATGEPAQVTRSRQVHRQEPPVISHEAPPSAMPSDDTFRQGPLWRGERRFDPPPERTEKSRTMKRIDQIAAPPEGFERPPPAPVEPGPEPPDPPVPEPPLSPPAEKDERDGVRPPTPRARMPSPEALPPVAMAGVPAPPPERAAPVDRPHPPGRHDDRAASENGQPEEAPQSEFWLPLSPVRADATRRVFFRGRAATALSRAAATRISRRLSRTYLDRALRRLT